MQPGVNHAHQLVEALKQYLEQGGEPRLPNRGRGPGTRLCVRQSGAETHPHAEAGASAGTSRGGITERLGDRIAELAMPQRLGTTLLGWSSTLALALAVVGGYGAVAYVVTQRTREIGIRMALGAPSSAVVRLVLANSMLAVGVGLAVGLVGAYALTRFTAPFLFGIATRASTTNASSSSATRHARCAHRASDTGMDPCHRPRGT